MLVLITDEAWGLKADLALHLPFPIDGQCLCLGSPYPAFTGCLNMFQVLIIADTLTLPGFALCAPIVPPRVITSPPSRLLI